MLYAIMISPSLYIFSSVHFNVIQSNAPLYYIRCCQILIEVNSVNHDFIFQSCTYHLEKIWLPLSKWALISYTIFNLQQKDFPCQLDLWNPSQNQFKYSINILPLTSWTLLFYSIQKMIASFVLSFFHLRKWFKFHLFSCSNLCRHLFLLKTDSQIFSLYFPSAELPPLLNIPDKIPSVYLKIDEWWTNYLLIITILFLPSILD